MKLLFYDFEVFKNDWLVVFINYDTKEKTIIVNDLYLLTEFYKINQETIFCGYNSRLYDQFIFKGLLKGLNPYDINKKIIEEDKNGYQVIGKSDDFPLNNFDVCISYHGLKQLEGFMGSKIKESNVPFDIKRKLREKELEEVIEYCIHDVEETINVFDNRKEEFESQLLMIQTFDLSMKLFNKTKAQLSAFILGAERHENRGDEFKLQIPDTLVLNSEHEYIRDWYLEKSNQDYKKSLITDVAGVPHVFAWGGLHGAINNYFYEGIILCLDVASLYPSLMIEYNYQSRNIKDIKKYKEIRDRRLKLKAEKNPMQLPMKIILNATYGCMKDKHNPLYDPLMANNVCISGQLLLLDLIEKIQPYCELIQTNTDGLFLKVEKEEDIQVIKNVAKEWEKRTRLDLEWEIFNKIYQKDVNNYIIINSEGKYKSKGAYVKKLSKIDYDLPIINKALINYFTKEIPVEYTINECNNLHEFQKIVKISNKFKYILHGEKQIKEKTLRVFADKSDEACGLFHVKLGKDTPDKIPNTPEKCFIYNDNVVNVEVPKNLDKEYYIEIAKSRIQDFIDEKEIRKHKPTPSEIKYISCENKEKLEELINMNFENFTDFLIFSRENTNLNSKHIEIYAKLGYLRKFGNSKTLFTIAEEFYKSKNKYNKNVKQNTKDEKRIFFQNMEKTLNISDYTITEKLQYDIEFLGEPKSIHDVPAGTLYIMELDVKKDCSPRAKGYGLSSGKMVDFKINKNLFRKNKFETNSIIQVLGRKEQLASKYMGKDDAGKALFEKVPDKVEMWVTNYKVVKK